MPDETDTLLPEQRARVVIDAQLRDAGRVVVLSTDDVKGEPVALKEFRGVEEALNPTEGRV